jgi:hypothetical protein
MKNVRTREENLIRRTEQNRMETKQGFRNVRKNLINRMDKCDEKNLLLYASLYKIGRTPWTGDQPYARPSPIHRTTQTHGNILVHHLSVSLLGSLGTYF